MENLTDDVIIQGCLDRAREAGQAPGKNWMRKRFNIGYSRAKRLQRETMLLLDSSKSEEPLVDWNENEDEAILKGYTTNYIATPDQLIELMEIDIRIWHLEGQTVHKHDVITKNNDGKSVVNQAFGIRLRFTRKKKAEILVHLFDDILDEIRDHAPTYDLIPADFDDEGEYLLVVNLPDHHFGKLAWWEESGGNYDIKIATELYLDGIRESIKAYAHLEVAQILYIVGNDLLHVDSGKNETTAGTPQDVDGRWQKAYRAAFKSVVMGADLLMPIAPVDLLIQPGNHDKERAWLMGEALSAWYRNTDRVNIINNPSPRKYYNKGNVLLGIAHGDGENLKNLYAIMADESGELWTTCNRREWLTGHIHKKQQISTMPLIDEKGVLIRTLPSLTKADAWHTKKGYHSTRAAVALAYSIDGKKVIDTMIAANETTRQKRGIFVIKS